MREIHVIRQNYFLSDKALSFRFAGMIPIVKQYAKDLQLLRLTLSVFHPVSVERQDIDVCFVGAAYGIAPFADCWLRKRGFHIQCFGRGWGQNSYLPHWFQTVLSVLCGNISTEDGGKECAS